MNKKAFLFPVLSVLVLVSMLLVNVQPASAQEPTEVKLTGSVVNIDALTRSFVLKAKEGQEFTIFVPEDFDLGTLAEGDLVEVEGTSNEDGSIAAVKITIVNETVEVDFTGSVVSLDPLANTFVVKTEGGEVYTVAAPEGFDWTTLAAGDLVEVKGILNEDGSVAAATIVIQTPEDDKEASQGNYCTQSEVPHPFGARLAERYQVDYATLQAWFCEGYGWGQIMLALQTGKLHGDDPSALLAARRAGAGWGQIWHELGLIGKSKDSDSPNDGNGDGRPDKNGLGVQKDGSNLSNHTGNPNDLNGDGLPDQAGSNKPEKHNPEKHNPGKHNPKKNNP